MQKEDYQNIIKKLPKCPDIMGRERYFNSGVLVPLVYLNGEYVFLFQKRASNIRQAGEICFPGGGHEPHTDNDYRDTAIRETIEELGIKKESIHIDGTLDTFVAHMGAVINIFVGRLKIKNLSELNINKSEVEEIITIPVSHFIDNKADEYEVRVEIQPSYIDDQGKKNILLPAKELGLPEKYHQPWGGKKHRVLVYKTEKGTIWGITAEIINDFINKLTK